jgi:acyl-ACP thioesterase
MYYTLPYTIPNFICDNHDTLTAWGCARLLQQAADNHTKLFGIGFQQLQEQHKAWVLCRTYYDVRRLPMDYEEVTVRTWSRGTDGLYAWRDFEMTDSQGTVIVAGATSWVVIDTNARHVVRLGAIVEGFEHHPVKATDLDSLGRIRFPKGEEGELVVEHQQVKYSMLDHTQHVNNAEYIKWIFDNLPEGTTQSAPFKLDVEYLQETRPDDEVSIHRLCQPDGTLLFKISNPRTTAVVATLKF